MTRLPFLWFPVLDHGSIDYAQGMLVMSLILLGQVLIILIFLEILDLGEKNEK